MVVTTNGFPKHGNHALVKALQLLGQPCSVNHIPFADGVSGSHIYIKRDPRNALCSLIRFNGQSVTPGMFISWFRSNEQGVSLCAEMAEFVGWISDAKTLVVRYEELISSDVCMRGIAAALGVPYIDGAFEALPGLTRTWYPDHSDYATIWTPEVEAVWSAEGGPELLAAWGY